MNITAQTKICTVIGDPVGHSLSPLIFNIGFRALGLDFVFIGAKVKKENLGDFIKGVRSMNIRGISCTIPHKLQIMKYLDETDEVARKIGAVNTVVNENGKLKGYNSDWIGFLTALEKYTDLKKKKVLLLGAGGVARAALFGLVKKEAEVSILNRTKEKAEKLVKEFGGRVAEDYEVIAEADIIINATSIGMYPQINESPIVSKSITNKQIVIDIVYNPLETMLLRDAKSQGATIIHGTEMFLAQAAFQFKLFTGHDAPEDGMKKVLLETLEKTI